MTGVARNGTREIRNIEGRSVVLSSLDKILWPAARFTKGELIDYYTRVAPVLLPHIAGRPLTLGRFPDGVDAPGFAQTECRGSPEWMSTIPIRLRNGKVRNYCLANDLPSLIWIANLGTLELHPFLACAPLLDRPAGIVFDLDPEEPAGIVDCARVAVDLRETLAEQGLIAVAKTSGSAGIHVLVPLNSPHSFEETKAFARALAERLAAGDPRIVAHAGRRAERAGRVLVDWAQNSARRSTVAPYSLRAADQPAVSTPVSCAEVERSARRGEALAFGPADTLERVAAVGDLFADALSTVQRVELA